MPTSASLSSTGNLALARITPSKSKLRQSQAIQKAPATDRGGIGDLVYPLIGGRLFGTLKPNRLHQP